MMWIRSNRTKKLNKVGNKLLVNRENLKLPLPNPIPSSSQLIDSYFRSVPSKLVVFRWYAMILSACVTFYIVYDWHLYTFGGADVKHFAENIRRLRKTSFLPEQLCYFIVFGPNVVFNASYSHTELI